MVSSSSRPSSPASWRWSTSRASKSGELTLDGPTLARIFLGEIRSWNDAAIRKLNPNTKLPSQAIVVVRRSDGSGTTFAFTDFLAKVSPDWKSKIGSTVAVEWPTGIGVNGNEGVANSVARIKGAIGYVEYAYATQYRLTYTKLINRDGKAVAPAVAAFAPPPPTRTGRRRRASA